MNNQESYNEFAEIAINDATFALDTCLKFFTLHADIKNNILDIGCGPGKVTKDVLLPKLPDNAEVYAIDKEKKMLDSAEKNNQSPKIKYICMDLMECFTRFEKNYFHQIFSFYCLHWINDQRKAFEIVFDLLKPGGTALITLVATTPAFGIYETLGKEQKYAQYHTDLQQHISPYYHLKNPKEYLENILTNIGFNIHVCDLIKRQYRYSKEDTLKGFLNSVNPFTGNMPEKIREEYLQEFVERFKVAYKDKMFYNIMLLTCISKPE